MYEKIEDLFRIILGNTYRCSGPIPGLCLVITHSGAQGTIYSGRDLNWVCYM